MDVYYFEANRNPLIYSGNGPRATEFESGRAENKVRSVHIRASQGRYITQEFVTFPKVAEREVISVEQAM